MKRVALVTLITLSVSFLTACGGGGSNATTNITGDGGTTGGGTISGDGTISGGTITDDGTIPSGSGTAGINPVTPLTISNTQTFTVQGQQRTYTQESGFDGNIVVVTETTSFNGVDFVSQIVQLANGTPSINVVDAQRTEAIDFSCDDGTNAQGTISSDFSSGIVVSTGTANGQTLSCTSTFQSVLPTTISDTSSISDLLEYWGSDDDLSNAAQTGLISTTCPQGNDDFDDIDPTTVICTGSLLTNYTVTDDNNQTHKFSTKISF